jgi:NADPH:quinone reductase-like Zn-dependent oxidoreductase
MTMRAAVIDSFGPPDVLRLAEMPVPEPRSGEVLVAVGASAVNAIDWQSRAGAGVPVHTFPAVLGWDISGRIVATGPDTHRFAEGDDVFGMLRFPELASAYAEFVVAREDEIVAKPAGVDRRQAVGAMIGITAWQSLFDHARLERGQRLLVHGAAGGVGHVAVQLAKHAGATVVATASPRNRDFLLALGADDVADYRATRLLDAVGTFDVALDTRGGGDFYRLVDLVNPGGIIVSLKGRAESHEAAVQRRGIRAAYEKVAPDATTLGSFARLLTRRVVTINVDEAFRLEDVAAAHAMGEAGHVRGLLVLDFDGD